MKIPALYNSNEQQLVKYCQGNDAAAQKALYGRYAESMMVVCLRYIANPEDAKEVLMDSFIRCFSHISTFIYRGEGSLKAWLKKIVINQCLMHLRKKQVVFANSREITAYDEVEAVESTLASLSAKEIIAAVHTLPDGYRAVFNLYVFEGFNHKEIGEMMNITENTSKSQLHRARTLLKEKLLQEAKINY